ncbi:MAG TPA: DUF4340 domain-containing protein [Stellaceae bacterium]|jgi:hypothetical protein|nr:DUF4340 domain-containing protein [Stellaceae bacterium]
MQRRGFLLLLGATAVSVGGAAVALQGGGTATTAPPGERALPDLASNLGQIGRMRITRGAMKANFALDDGHWVVVEKGGYPADEGRLRRMLSALADLTLIEPKTQQPELYSRLDVDDPANGKATELWVQNKAGAIVGQLIVGRSRPDRLGLGNDGVYVRRVGEDRAWLARGAVDVSGDIAQWLDRRILDILAGQVAAMVFTGADGQVLRIGRKTAAELFAVADVPEGTKLKGTAEIAAPAGALEELDLADVEPAALRKLPDTGVATAEYTMFGGLGVAIRLFAADQKDWAVFEVSGIDDAAVEAKALRNRIARWVYAIPPDRAKLLRTRLDDLVAKAGG